MQPMRISLVVSPATLPSRNLELRELIVFTAAAMGKKVALLGKGLFFVLLAVAIFATLGCSNETVNRASHSQTDDSQDAYDMLILGGDVLDGTGARAIKADVGVRGGKIATIGDLANAEATRVINAESRLIVPGFIDIHSHAGGRRGLVSSDVKRRAAPNLVSQGITTVVVNADGFQSRPIDQHRAAMMDPGIGLNAVLMAGHNSIRRSVLGDDYKRLATEGEIAAMRKMTREAIAQGAFGLTAGLEYSPGIWSTTEEVIALVEEIVPSDGVYIPHTRSSGISPKWYTPSQDPPTPPTLLEAVEETIKIGETTGAKTVLTHIKSRGVDTWGTAGKVVNMLEAARQRGVRIYADQYPYNTSGSDGRVVLIPDWAINYDRDNPPTDYAAELRKTLGDPVKVAALRRDIRHEMRLRGGADTMLILDHPKPAYVGMTVGELATICGLDPVGLAIVFQLTGHKDKRGGVKLRGFSMLKEDVAIYAAQPWTATATDGGIAFPEDGSVHARLYGTFPRKIARFARDQGVLSVEAAVRSATSLPAEIMGITDRGIIKEGFHADIVVFDLETLEDRATFLEPHQTPKGIETVIVNGKLVVDNEEVTGALPGVVLSR